MCEKTRLCWLPVCFSCFNDDCGLLTKLMGLQPLGEYENGQHEHAGCCIAAHSPHSEVAGKQMMARQEDSWKVVTYPPPNQGGF